MLAALVCLSAGTVVARNPKSADPKTAPQPEKYVFTDLKTVPATSVKDQSRSGTCWCFSGVALLESDLLRRSGDTVDLSEMWIVRHAYYDKALRYARMHGKTNLDAGGISYDVPYMMSLYGIVPDSVYRGLNYGTPNHVHGELNAVIKSYMDAVIAAPNKTLSTAWKEGLNGRNVPVRCVRQRGTRDAYSEALCLHLPDRREQRMAPAGRVQEGERRRFVFPVLLARAAEKGTALCRACPLKLSFARFPREDAVREQAHRPIHPVLRMERSVRTQPAVPALAWV